MQIFNLFIPCIAWVTIAMFYPLVAWKSKYLSRLECLFLFMAAGCFLFGFAYAGQSDTLPMLVSLVLGQYSVLVIIPMVMVFFCQVRNGKHGSNRLLFSYFLPVAFIFSDIALLSMTFSDPGRINAWNYLLGHDMPASALGNLEWICRFHQYGFWVLASIEIIGLAVALSVGSLKKGGGIGLFFKGEGVDPLNLVGAISLLILLVHAFLVIPSPFFMISHPWYYGALSLSLLPLVVIASFLAKFLDEKSISIRDLGRSESPVPANGPDAVKNDGGKADSGETIATIQTIGKELVTMIDNFKQDEELSLRARFENLMIHQQAFLTPGITLTDVAEALHTNKTYLSRMIHTTYTLAFPDYLNTLRIDYAEQYILKHRDAKQDEIAKACGFPSASSFNTSFKKLTGVTPKIWLATKI